MDKLTREQAVTITAYTGKLCCPLDWLYEDFSKRLGRPVFTHEMGMPNFWTQIRSAYETEFIAMCPTEGGRVMPKIRTSLTNEEIFALMPPARNYRGEMVTVADVAPQVFDTLRRLIDFGIERAIFDQQVAPLPPYRRPGNTR